MKDEEEPSKLVGILISLVPLGFGIWMLAAPHLMDGAKPHGRRLLMKKMVAWIWGYPCGVILVIVGVLILWGAFLPPGPDDEDDDDDE